MLCCRKIAIRLPCLVLCILLLNNLIGSSIHFAMAEVNKIYGCDFEVFGRVQGVFFRKHTQQTAKKLHINGWCMNTAEGTVRGQLEGQKSQLDEMKKWLSETGSPKSCIEKAVFSETIEIRPHNFKEFSIKR